jgi:hypothetical protein
MFTFNFTFINKNIQNIISEYIQLSGKKILQYEKEILNKYIWVLISHNNFSENVLLGIFTSYDKAYKYKIRHAIVNYSSNIKIIDNYINENYNIIRISYNINKPIYLCVDIYRYNIFYIEEILTHNKDKSYNKIEINIDPIIKIN